MYYSWWTITFTVVTVICILLFFVYYRKASLPAAGTTEWITRKLEKHRLSFHHHRYRLEKRDIIPILAIAVAGAVLNYLVLGDTTAPQSFFRFTAEMPSVTIELEEPQEIGEFRYYTALWTGEYKLEFSSDGVNWLEQTGEGEDEPSMGQGHADLYKWRVAALSDGHKNVRYIRITSSEQPMELGELALYDASGAMIPASRIISPDCRELFDEQELVPETPGYMNSMYFDEIYHGRTAYEHIHNVKPYEISHPPLGKIIISIGIQLFGMTAFGWRFMGATFGWLMLVVLYIFLKNMFGKTVVATCGSCLFLFDFMRFTQTRIATIDTYGVFFIMLAYFFMYRYITQPPETRLGKTLPPLFLSGLFFGVGCACKWIVIYAGAGLAILYVIHQVLKWRYYSSGDRYGYAGYLVGTLAASVVCFIFIPAVIYYLSYIPYGLAEGMTVSGGMLTDPRYMKIIMENQKFMFTYHAGLEATHPYSSVWWEWILDLKPILYFRSYLENGQKSLFAAFGNPVVWWGGLLAMIAMAVRAVKYRDGRALFILIGYLIQLIPWIIISRIVFIYHYFPCVLFMVMALSHVFNTIWERRRGRYKLAVIGYTAASALLFALFYPVLTGVPVSDTFARYVLRWIPPIWPF